MFDHKTTLKLRYYVYTLIDPKDKKPFYVGKGFGNRVFEHMNLALAISEKDKVNAKYEKIRVIKSRNAEVRHLIIRHGLTELEAFEIEAALIDAFDFCKLLLTNKSTGRNSIERGLMTANEIKRLYNAKPLLSMDADCILININQNYKRGGEEDTIYQATKETWTISKKKILLLKYVLSEYKGLIVEVFEVIEWYPKERGFSPKAKRFGETKIGYGFNGVRAPDEIRNKYLNKTIAHTKKKGAASAIRYTL